MLWGRSSADVALPVAHQTTEKKPLPIENSCGGITIYCIRQAMKRFPESFRSATLFEVGCGYLVLSRYKSDGRVEAGFFLLDVFCLGVKDAGFCRFTDFADFEKSLLDPLFREDGRERMMPGAGRKLAEEAVAYARSLGFAPGADYKKASRVFGGISTADCSEQFDFGKDGKPFYIQGPSDSPERREWILRALETRCGEGGFQFIVASECGDSESADEAASEPAQSRTGTGWNADALREMARQVRTERPELDIRISPTGRPKLSDRLAEVAGPWLERMPDPESGSAVLLLAALAWNFSLSSPAVSQQFLDAILGILPEPELQEMFLFTAARRALLYPDEDRIICKVETDPAAEGRYALRVMSLSLRTIPASETLRVPADRSPLSRCEPVEVA